MKRYLNFLAGLVGLIILLGVIGFLVLPPIVKPLLMGDLSVVLHREVALEKISVNPFTLTATIKGLTIREPGQQHVFASFDELYVNVQALSSIFKKSLILKEIRLTKPYVNIARHDDGTYNFSDLIPKGQPPEKEKKEPFHFSLNNIRIINGAVDFDDQPARTQHKVSDIDLHIPFLSNIAHDVEIFVEPKFSAKVNGRQYELAGKTKPFSDSREMTIDMEIKDVDVPYYLNYVPAKMNCKLVSAALDAKINVNFIMQKGSPPRLKIAGDLALKNVAVDDLQKNKVLRLPALNVAAESVEPLVPDIHIAKISLQTPELSVVKSKDGKINLAGLVAPAPKKDQESKDGKDAPAPEKAKSEGAKLKARVDEFTIESGNVVFTDNSPRKPVRVSVTPLKLKLANFSTGEGKAGNMELSMLIDNTGSLSISGPVKIDPVLTADFSIEASNIAIRAFQPYFTDKVRINVKRGSVSTSGRLAYGSDKEKKPQIRYSGKVSVSNLATMDKAFSNDFLNWKQLYFDQVETGFNPFFLNIKGISLTDFYARIIINPDGTLNVQQIFGKEKKEGEKGAEQAAAPAAGAEKTAKKEGMGDIKIGKVTFQGGTVDFSDQHIKPDYSAEMLNIGGSITGLSSDASTRAAVDLRGNLGHGSPIEIKGRINPLIKDLYADMNLVFRDIELSPTTPYTSKYLGYPILKGKLTFDVSYFIENRKLESKNKVFIDQLTFGEKTESPDAVKAPVTLAASLLSDRKGQINLDIPVSGSLDDPQFKVWPIIWKIVVNLITKAVTAPFSLIASLIGGGEEMSYVEFDYGSDRLTDAGKKKVESLARALYERPNLKMDITGYVDPENDREGLKRVGLERKMKARKLNEIARKGDTSASLDSITIEKGEYLKYLTLAYKAEKFPKPRNIIGLAKDLPAGEMEKLILSHTEVTPSDLRLLASRRAENIKEGLLKSGQVQSGRIFIVEPRSASPEKKENVKDSRADFKLK